MSRYSRLVIYCYCALRYNSGHWVGNGRRLIKSLCVRIPPPDTRWIFLSINLLEKRQRREKRRTDKKKEKRNTVNEENVDIIVKDP